MCVCSFAKGKEAVLHPVVLLKSINKEMVMKSLITLSLAIVLILSIQSLSQETLSRSEILDIVDQLMRQPRRTWIQTGTLDISHTEYKAPRLTDSAEIEERVQQAISDFPNNPLKKARAAGWQKKMLEALPFNTRWELGNESTMTTHELLTVDGDRFYLDITINSRKDSIKPPPGLTYNSG
jgi:hypothetical protein